jgi:hypothetical protein
MRYELTDFEWAATCDAVVQFLWIVSLTAREPVPGGHVQRYP